MPVLHLDHPDQSEAVPELHVGIEVATDMRRTLRRQAAPLAVCALATILLAGCARAVAGSAAPAATATGCPAGGWTVVGRTAFPRTTLSVMFADASFGIATDTGGGIYYTEDGGGSWTYAATAGLSRVALDMMDPGMIWHIGLGGALSRSTDRGRTWQFIRSLPHNRHLEYLSFADPLAGWALSTERTDLFVTENGGQSWNTLPLPDGMEFPAAINLRTPAEGRLLDTAGNLFTSLDGGTTWRRGSIGLAAGETIPTLNHSAAMRFTGGGNGVIALETLAGGGGRAYALRTADGGATWTEEALPLPMGMFHLTWDGMYLTHVDLIDQSKITILCSAPTTGS
jgi:hypothetical protein